MCELPIRPLVVKTANDRSFSVVKTGLMAGDCKAPRRKILFLYLFYICIAIPKGKNSSQKISTEVAGGRKGVDDVLLMICCDIGRYI